MTKRVGAILASASITVGAVLVRAAGAPDWAYGYTTPAASGDSAPACADHRPISCARPGAPRADDGTLRHLPGTSAAFTLTEIAADYGPADWYPGDHPPMPDIVAHGREKDGVRACGLCHFPNGKGKPENGSVAGLTVGYIVQQIADFKNGLRKSADPRKANTNEMIGIAKMLTDVETRAAAEYFASMKWTPYVKVVETQLMKRVVENLSDEDVVAIAAYLASRVP